MTFHAAKPYTSEQESAVMSMRAKGYTMGAIAKKMDRSESSIEACVYRLEKREAQAKKQIRACMCCKKPFSSDGPHNRLCRTCRSKEKTRFDY